jgi:adenylate cyclase
MEQKSNSGRPSVSHARRADLSYLEAIFSAEAGWRLSSILAWVIEEGRHLKNPAKFIARLCDRLIEAGAPVWRLGLHVRTMHPRFAAWYLTWSRDSNRVDERMVGHSLRDTVDYDGSPVQRVRDGADMVRCSLNHLDAKVDHPSLQFLAARGGTDYVAFPLDFSTGQSNALCIATDHPGGFSELDIAKFRVLTELLALPIEVFVEHRTALALLDTYVGPRAGRRVLQGLIRRGDGDVIEAAIWFSDLRDFTAITEAVPWAQLLEMLNDYFALVDAAIRAQGGEILHFIGDAILTVFPIPANGDRRQPCQAALEAARDAFAAVATVNKRRSRAGQAPIRFGVGLHVGEVIYGNIGSSDRLNFTVMGAAVNRAARLQNMTKTLSCSVVASAQFAACIDEPNEFLGRYPMKGVKAPQEVYTFEGLCSS